MTTLQSRRRIKTAKGRWDNSPAGIRRRNAERDARREAVASTLPPVPSEPEPGSLWCRIVIEAYVPTCAARCDQHAMKIDGKIVGLLSASKLGELVRGIVPSRPSVALMADVRRELWAGT